MRISISASNKLEKKYNYVVITIFNIFNWHVYKSNILSLIRIGLSKKLSISASNKLD